MLRLDGITKVFPGVTALNDVSFDVKSGGHELREYYSVLNHVAADGKSDPDDFGPLFSTAVQKRLMSDVPLGLQLSGGVDSSLVAEQLVRLTKDHHCNSFNIGFKARDEQRYSEEGYARHVAGELGFVHHQVNVTHGDPVKTGSLYNTVMLYETPAKDGKWWTQRIVVKGKDVKIYIDDKLVLHFREPPGVQGDKRLSKGLFAFQQHDPGSIVRYKNVMVKRLPD